MVVDDDDVGTAEYYITCFRCINSFRDGSGGLGRRPASAYDGGLVKSRGARVCAWPRSNRFFRGDSFAVVNETSYSVSTVNSAPPSAVRSSDHHGCVEGSSHTVAACILFTSTETARPAGVLLRHYWLPFRPLRPSFPRRQLAARAVDLSNAQGRAPSGYTAKSTHAWSLVLRARLDQLNVTRLSDDCISFPISPRRASR